jgi:Gas vesicle protein
MPTPVTEGHGRSTGFVDVLDRVLDKGLVVAGDIKMSLAELELLTIRIRLLICSIDKAEQIGLDWWKFDDHLSPGKRRSRQRMKSCAGRCARSSGSVAHPPAIGAGDAVGMLGTRERLRNQGVSDAR